MTRSVYAGRVLVSGEFHEKTLLSALNLSIALVKAGNASESKTFTRPLLPLARRALGADHHIPLRLAHSYAYAFMDCTNSSRDELIFAEKLLEDTARRLRRVLGISHPGTANAEGDLAILRRRIAKL